MRYKEAIIINHQSNMKSFFLTLMLSFSAMATTWCQQQGQISGRLSAEGKPLSATVVSLLTASDGQLIRTEITDESGNFQFGNLPYGGYLLFVEDPDLESYQSERVEITAAASSKDVGTILMRKLTSEMLNEVTVVRKKPLIENKIDKVVVNVDAMMAASGGDAMDVLAKSPGIMVDQEGRITFKGKSGVAVFIDGKPTYMSGSDLEAYLKSLPASTLNQIELMTNPPAKFDAAGSAGIINITTKKSNVRGMNGSITSRFHIGKTFRTGQGANLNYVTEKFRAFGNAGYDYYETYNDLSIYRRFKNPDNTVNQYFDQHSILKNKGQGGLLRAGLDYYLTEKTTIGVLASGLIRQTDASSDVNSDLRNAANLPDSTVLARNRNDGTFSNATVNLNLRHDFSETSKLSADADYLYYENSANQLFRNFTYQPDGNLSSEDEQVGTLPSNIHIISLKTDYSKQFKNGISVDGGYKYSGSKTDNTADYRNRTPSGYVPDYNQSNHFKYDETIHAAYANASANYRRFSFQAGLRFEATDSKGNQLGNPEREASRFRRNYSNLFPTAYVQYKLDSIGDNTLVMSYGKRINRPFYEDLNPFVSPLDKFTFYAGNPYLNPSFAHNTELSYRFKNYFSATASYAFTEGEINETIEINDGIYYSRPGNIGQSKYYTLSANATIPFAKWLSSQIYSEVTHTVYKSRLYTETLDASGTFWVINANNTLTFTENWSAEVSGSYQTRVVSAQFEMQSRGSMTLAVQRKILGSRGKIRLIANDIFYSNIYRGQINNLQNTDANWINRPYSRFVTMAFSYSFGKELQSRSPHEASGAESEKNRVKS